MEVIGAGRPLTKPAAPWIALPTTAGTGAEVTRNAVIGDPSRKFKASLRSELLLPRVALVDPELGVTVPPDVTAASGMDALCQLIESYTSNNANPITRPLAFRGISIAAQALPQVYKNGTNVTARQDMALAALLSGICLTNAGLGAVHGFAAPLGANFPVPHGVVCAALLPHVMAANIAALRAHPLERRRSLPVDVKERSATLRAVMLHPVLGDYALIGRMLSFWEPREGAEDPAAAAALLVESLHIPRLGQFGITEQHVPEMVALARKASSMRYNPVELSDEALAGVLRAAL
jgi:alcohol dehydrogenase class IV